MRALLGGLLLLFDADFAVRTEAAVESGDFTFLVGGPLFSFRVDDDLCLLESG